MEISETSQKVYEGISKILKENGQSFSKAQQYAVESMVQTIEEATEKRCCEMTEKILAKAKKIESESKGVSDATVEKVNEMVEKRISQLKRELPQLVDYAKMKKMSECMETIKECVGYRTDEQVEKVANESAKALHSTKTLIQTQAKAISEKSASLNESTKEVKKLNEKIQQMQKALDAKDKQIVESTKMNKELVASNQNLQKKVEQSKKINESLEEQKKEQTVKLYLEEKISQYPKYEASLLRKHFANAKTKAEIDENFNKALALVQGSRDKMAKMKPVPVAPIATKVNESTKISGGTIVTENGINEKQMSETDDDSFYDIDEDQISNEQMAAWISRM